MKKIILAAFCLTSLSIISSCKKDEVTEETITSTQVLADFANTVVNPNYLDIQAKASALSAAITELNTNTTDANLSAARNAWKALRQPWEQCEAFLFGPVEDFNYDPTMDTWPVNKTDLDSLLSSANPLSISDIDALAESLKGFHPLEYVLFGSGGTKTAADFTAREKQYMVSLTQSLYNTTTALRNSWDPNNGNFTHQVVNAGNGSNRYATRKDALVAIVTAMAGICDEVAGGKMEDPLTGGPGGTPDSTLEESQFSHNSTTDFKNNITGVLNAYIGKYTNDGHGLNEIVAAKNTSLDNTLQTQMNAAINSFNSIDANYGAAVYTQQVQIHNAQSAINTLKTTLENDLINFIQVNIND